MLKNSIFTKSVPVALSVFIFASAGLSSQSADASTIGISDVSSHGADHGRAEHMSIFADIELSLANASMIMLPATGNPEYGYGRPEYIPGKPAMGVGRPGDVPRANPPIDTPALNNGLVNAPTMMPASVPYDTLPGSGFGQAVVPVPAAVWLFGSGLLGLIGMARRKKAA
jgi:hypothetical protein